MTANFTAVAAATAAGTGGLRPRHVLHHHPVARGGSSAARATKRAGSWVANRKVVPRSAFICGEEVHDLGRRPRVQVRRRLVGEDGQRVVNERAGQGDALPLPARELVRPVTQAIGEAHRGQRLFRPSPALRARHAVDPQRVLDVLERGEDGQQVERLEHEAELSPPRGASSRAWVSEARSAPAKRTWPSSGSSRQPRRFRRLVFPLPEGPATTTNSPAFHVERGPAQRFDDDGAQPIALAEAAGLEEHSRGYRKAAARSVAGVRAEHGGEDLLAIGSADRAPRRWPAVRPARPGARSRAAARPWPRRRRAATRHARRRGTPAVPAPDRRERPGPAGRPRPARRARSRPPPARGHPSRTRSRTRCAPGIRRRPGPRPRSPAPGARDRDAG